MKALVKTKKEKGIWMDDVPEPICGSNDVKIKIKKTAICGTDIHIYNWDDWAKKTIPVPMTIGHEYMGAVYEIGSEVTNISIGDRVSGEGHIVCGHCRNCLGGRLHLCKNTIGVGVNRNGAFAEFLVIPSKNVFKLPDHVSDELASIFDPFGNAVHTALSFDMVGEDVLITGAGPIGAMAARVCLHAGARSVILTDINDYRLDLAKKLTFCQNSIRTVNILKEDLNTVMKELGMKEGFDLGLEMSGVPSALQQMIDNMINGGKIAILGIPPNNSSFDLSQVIFKGLFIKGIYGREMFETWYKMGMLVESGIDLNPIITHRFNIDDYQEAFEIMASGNSGKVILNW